MAAKTKTKDTTKVIIKSKVSRPGRHSKKNTSGLKTSKNYVKLSRGQGK